MREPVFGAWPEPIFHSPPSSSPHSRSLLCPDLNQQTLLDNNVIIYYLLGFYTAVSCGLPIDTPVPSEDLTDKNPPRQTSSYIRYLCSCERDTFKCIDVYMSGDKLYRNRKDKLTSAVRSIRPVIGDRVALSTSKGVVWSRTAFTLGEKMFINCMGLCVGRSFRFFCQ